MKNDFGNDVFTKRVILEIMLVIIGLASLAWLTINTTIWQTAQIFWIFGLMGLIGIITSFVIKGPGKSDIFDVAVSEQPMIPINRKLLYVVFSIMFLFTFFLLAESDYRIAAPSFQLVELGVFGDAILTIFAAIMEDIFFFALMPGLIFSFMYWITGKFWPSIIVVLLLSPTVFMFYHLAVYGFSNQPAMVFVFIFGLEMTAMMILFRDITYAHARHIGNNLGILLFSQMSLQTFLITITGNVYFYLILLAVGGVVFLKLRK